MTFGPLRGCEYWGRSAWRTAGVPRRPRRWSASRGGTRCRATWSHHRRSCSAPPCMTRTLRSETVRMKTETLNLQQFYTGKARFDIDRFPASLACGRASGLGTPASPARSLAFKSAPLSEVKITRVARDCLEDSILIIDYWLLIIDYVKITRVARDWRLEDSFCFNKSKICPTASSSSLNASP